MARSLCWKIFPDSSFALERLASKPAAGNYGSRTRKPSSMPRILLRRKFPGQLIGLAREFGIPYVRYERPETRSRPTAIYCRDMEAAAAEAAAKGTRIFLATGTKDLSTFLKHRLATEREWFVRVAPDPASLERALRLGIPRAHLCAMQGPFSKEFNETLWRSWDIDCVVTKDSGEAGGFQVKADAAQAIGAALIVVERPRMELSRRRPRFSDPNTISKQVA